MRKFNILIFILLLTMITTASALPEMLDGFNKKYKTSGTRLDTCDLCHIPGKPEKASCNEICHDGKPVRINDVNLNPYGMALKKNINMHMDKAFESIEILDSGQNGFTNIEAIHNLTFPGIKEDFPNKKKISANVMSNNVLPLGFTKLLELLGIKT